MCEIMISLLERPEERPAVVITAVLDGYCGNSKYSKCVKSGDPVVEVDLAYQAKRQEESALLAYCLEEIVARVGLGDRVLVVVAVGDAEATAARLCQQAEEGEPASFPGHTPSAVLFALQPDDPDAPLDGKLIILGTDVDIVARLGSEFLYVSARGEVKVTKKVTQESYQSVISEQARIKFEDDKKLASLESGPSDESVLHHTFAAWGTTHSVKM